MESAAALSLAIRQGDVPSALNLLSSCPQLISTQGPRADSLPPLLDAARYGQTKLVQVLIEKGADVDTHQPVGWTPLCFACHYGHEELVRLLLRKGANASLRTQAGWTPLMIAAAHGRLGIVRMLLSFAKQDVDACGDLGENALYLAAKAGSMEAVRALLWEGRVRVCMHQRYLKALRQDENPDVQACVEYIKSYGDDLERVYLLAKARRVVDERRAITYAPLSPKATNATAIQRSRWLASTRLTRQRVERGEELPRVEMSEQEAGERRKAEEGDTVKMVLKFALGWLKDPDFEAVVGYLRLR